MDGAGKTPKQLLVIAAYEIIGTALMITAFNFSNRDIVVVAFGILCAAILSAKITGAHVNSGITPLAVLMLEGFDKMRGNLVLTIVLIVSQMIGGYLGSFYSLLFLGENGIAVIGPGDPENTSVLFVFVIETFFTFILISGVLHTMNPRLSIQGDLVLGVLAGTAGIYFSVNCTGFATGASLNPVLGLVNPTFVAWVRRGTGQRNFLEYVPSYVCGNFIGGIFAGLFCR